MRKIIFLLVAACLCCISSTFAQDVIVRKNGEKIVCNIQSKDSTYIHFTVKKNGHNVETFLKRDEVSSIQYQQDIPKDYTYIRKNSLGVGLGLDYGGIGVNVMVAPHENIGLFGGVGFAMIGLGYNVGARFNISPEKKRTPYLMGMYGYNAAIGVSNKSSLNKFFYGVSLGAGVDFKSSRRNSFLSLALIIPLRGEKVDDYIQELKDDHNVEFKNELFPILISIGYKF